MKTVLSQLHGNDIERHTLTGNQSEATKKVVEAERVRTSSASASASGQGGGPSTETLQFDAELGGPPAPQANNQAPMGVVIIVGEPVWIPCAIIAGVLLGVVVLVEGLPVRVVGNAVLVEEENLRV